MIKSKIGVILILTISAFGYLMFNEVRGNVPAKSLTVMTYNVGTLNGERIGFDKIGEVIRKIGTPDLLLLQEVPGEKLAVKLAENLGLANYLYSSYKPGGKGNYGMTIMSRYPLINPEMLHFHRYASFMAKMVVEGKSYRIGSVHLERIKPIRINEYSAELSWKDALNLLKTEIFKDTSRSIAVDSLLSWMSSREFQHVIIGGDFNTVPFSKAIRKMGKKYKDALWPSVDYLTGSYNKLSLPIKPRIDYIFHSPDLKCDTASVIKESAGDHYPVRAVFDL